MRYLYIIYYVGKKKVLTVLNEQDDEGYERIVMVLWKLPVTSDNLHLLQMHTATLFSCL